ncbi:hypothetical protein NDU88_010221 [Pleurodeles waltl]|uniref:Endonuclease/exonuclease/phosphatase domain-containing protein n=1 Tax=Pleurodeles waltl TaxID=8319 RepID=A0AAV7S181_PLEWA|nr:hypothetical protein NDU88_010221 [Pleurodeles waltl]
MGAAAATMSRRKLGPRSPHSPAETAETETTAENGECSEHGGIAGEQQRHCEFRNPRDTETQRHRETQRERSYCEIFLPASRPSIFGRPSGSLSPSSSLAAIELPINIEMAQVISISGVNIDWDKIDLILVNCYINAPKKCKSASILELLEILESVIFNHPGNEIVMLGDFNVSGLSAQPVDTP